ncbi:MAG: hypothetical protein ACYDC3_17050 [Candidatus Binataceae bacterium]
MRRWAGVAAVIAMLTVLAMPIAAAAAGSSTLPPFDHDPGAEPPMVGGKPVIVSVSLHVINLSKIDDSAQHFDIDGYLFARWNDPRLEYVSKGPGDLIRTYRRGEIWIPRLEFVNATSPRKIHDTSISVAPSGNVTYVERFNAELSARFQLRRYPFDTQDLEIFVHPFVADANQIVFTLRDSDVWTASEFNTYSSLAQWDLAVMQPTLHVHREQSRTIAGVRFGMQVTRRSAYYIWKVFVPLLLMVCVSWGVFWIEPGDLSSQIQVSVTTILTVIAFAFAISSSMPRVPYLTYIDAFFLQCYVFVFVAFTEIMIVHVTHRSDRRRDLGLKVRNWSRIVVPSAFVASNVIIGVRFLG